MQDRIEESIRETSKSSIHRGHTCYLKHLREQFVKFVDAFDYSWNSCKHNIDNLLANN